MLTVTVLLFHRVILESDASSIMQRVAIKVKCLLILKLGYFVLLF